MRPSSSTALLALLVGSLLPLPALHAQPCAGGWTLVSPGASFVPPRAYTASATDQARGRVVLFGGAGADGILGDTWLYDGVVWTSAGSGGPPARTGHAMAYDPVRQRVVLFGGAGAEATLADTWEWDGATWTPRPVTGATPAPRTGHAMGYDAVGARIILVGGTGSETGLGLDDTWAWNGTEWTLLAPPTGGPGNRSGAGMVLDEARSRLVLFGGVDPSNSDVLNDTWEWDGAEWNLVIPLTAIPSEREGAILAFDDARDRVVMFGGNGAGDLGDTWEWDGLDWRLAAEAGAGAGFRRAIGYSAQRGRVVQLQPDTSATLAWDGTAWTRVATQGPVPLNSHAMTYDMARQAVLLFGGRTPLGTASGALWSWNGAAWTLANAGGDGSPPARERPALVFDTTRGRAILTGGGAGDDGFFDDTWAWNGAAWTQIDVPGPGARRGSAAAYDPVRDRVVLFGGLSTEFERLGDTWEFDGAAWTQRTPPASPLGRDRHVMEWDSARQRVVLYGGRDANFEQAGDLWEWDGATWTRRDAGAASQPSGRGSAGGAFASSVGRLVVHGGLDANFEASGETVLWDGSTLAVAPREGPGARSDFDMAFDAGRGAVILYGGFGQTTTGDTWAYDPALGPVVTGLPVGFDGSPGATVTLSVAVANAPGAGVQWRRDGQELVDGPTATGAALTGAGATTLTIAGAQAGDSGRYDAVVTTACGPFTTRAAAVSIFAVACSVADIVSIGGFPPFDGELTVDDYTSFINAFAADEFLADIVSIGGFPPPDGELTVDDYTSFINAFAEGCPG